MHNTITQRLNNLLEYFEPLDDEEDMRTFIQPEKNKPSAISKPGNVARIAANEPNSVEHVRNSFMEDADKVIPMRASNDVTTSAIVHIGPAAGSIPEARTAHFTPDNRGTTYHNGTHSQYANGIGQLGRGKGYKAHERHHFTRVFRTSFTSCTSPSGMYSETVVVLWVDSKAFIKYPSSTEKYRVTINFMYDAEDDLWSVSAKLLRRASTFSQKDEEEGQVNNRLCITSELLTEVKKMLLFLGVSPREVYKAFRRNMNEKFIISSSEHGFVTVESALHSKLMQDLEKSRGASTNWDSHTEHRGPYHNLPNHMREHGSRQSGVSEDCNDVWNGCMD